KTWLSAAQTAGPAAASPDDAGNARFPRDPVRRLRTPSGRGLLRLRLVLHFGVCEENQATMDRCLERARAGDRSAMDALATALRPRLARMAAHYARCSGEDPDDLLQEAWLGLLEALPDLDLRIGDPAQHLIQRARWRLLDAIRRSRRRHIDAAPESLLEELPDPMSTPLPDAVGQ